MYPSGLMSMTDEEFAAWLERRKRVLESQDRLIREYVVSLAEQLATNAPHADKKG